MLPLFPYTLWEPGQWYCGGALGVSCQIRHFFFGLKQICVYVGGILLHLATIFSLLVRLAGNTWEYALSPLFWGLCKKCIDSLRLFYCRSCLQYTIQSWPPPTLLHHQDNVLECASLFHSSMNVWKERFLGCCKAVSYHMCVCVWPEKICEIP